MDKEQRISLLKRTLKGMVQLPLSASRIADIEELEKMIVELGGDARTSAHRVILESKKRED